MKKIASILLSLALAVFCCAGTGLTVFAAEAVKADSIPVEIKLSGTLPATAENFTVVLKAKDQGNPMPEDSKDGVYTMTITGAGTKDLPSITYTRVGIYEYNVYQEKGSNAKVTYDDKVYTLKVYVTNADDYSELVVKALLYSGEPADKCGEIIFTNIYPTVTPPSDPTPADPTPTPEEPTPEVTPSAVPASTVVPPAVPVPTPTDAPKTGDESNPELYMALAGIGAAVLVLLTATRKRTGKTK